MFNRIDMRSGYNQLQIAEVNVPKITFRARYVHYEFLVMLVGLTSAPVAFIALMNKVSQHYLDKFIIILIDDILI